MPDTGIGAVDVVDRFPRLSGVMVVWSLFLLFCVLTAINEDDVPLWPRR